MTKVTQERLDKFISRLHSWHDKKRETKIYEALVESGFASLMGNYSRDRTGLELNILGTFDRKDLERRMAEAGIGEVELRQIRCRLGKRLENLKSNELDCIAGWMALYEHTRERVWAWRSLYLRIQQVYQVSGLRPTTLDFGHRVVEFFEPSGELELVEADHEVLAEQKWTLVDAFLYALVFNDMKLYQWKDEGAGDRCLTQPSPEDVMLATCQAETASVYSELYFVNQKELDEKGCTQVAQTPISPDHKKEWQITLWVGDKIFYAYQGEGYPTVC